MKQLIIAVAIVVTLLFVVDASAEVPIAPSPVAECVNIIMPGVYSPGMTPVDMMQVIQMNCGNELAEEISGAGLDIKNKEVWAAGLFFYSTEWLNRMLQDLLEYIAAGCPETGAPEKTNVSE